MKNTKQHPEHYSSISTFLKCPMKYYWSHKHEGWGIQKNNKNIPLAFGSAIHCGIEKGKDFALKKFDEILSDSNIDNNKIVASRANILPMLSLIKTIDKTKKGENELKFYINKIDFYGTIDKITKTKDVYTVIEYKTTSMLSNSLVRAAQYKMQDRIYCVALNCYGKKTNNIKHFLFQKTKIRLKKDEKLEDFENRIKCEYVINPDKYYAIIDVSLTREQLLKTYNDLCYLLNAIRKTKNYFKNTDNCVSLYGECSYFDICNLGYDFGYFKKEEPTWS